MDRKLHLLESFMTRGSDGSAYKVLGYEHMARNLTLMDGQEHWEPTGLAEYRLVSGELVEMGSDGTMRVVNTGVELTRH